MLCIVSSVTHLAEAVVLLLPCSLPGAWSAAERTRSHMTQRDKWKQNRPKPTKSFSIEGFYAVEAGEPIKRITPDAQAKSSSPRLVLAWQVSGE